ncbi:MAG: hypothetical protein QOC64_970 [Solirubrobacteraceae bacterium]|jgi:hypothetical protein|nr:hypothetical protein [Solirubrobacteraceae bacterium]
MGVNVPSGGYASALEELIARARVEHEVLLARLSPALQASLPVDATGVTQGIDVLATAVGIEDELRAQRDRLNRANPAVLHGRVFGRTERLSPETVVAAFAEGARARATLLQRLATAIGGDELRGEVERLLGAHPLPEGDAEPAERVARLQDAYDAQERAVVLCAARLDETRGG